MIEERFKLPSIRRQTVRLSSAYKVVPCQFNRCAGALHRRVAHVDDTTFTVFGCLWVFDLFSTNVKQRTYRAMANALSGFFRERKTHASPPTLRHISVHKCLASV